MYQQSTYSSEFSVLKSEPLIQINKRENLPFALPHIAFSPPLPEGGRIGREESYHAVESELCLQIHGKLAAGGENPICNLCYSSICLTPKPSCTGFLFKEVQLYWGSEQITRNSFHEQSQDLEKGSVADKSDTLPIYSPQPPAGAEQELGSPNPLHCPESAGGILIIRWVYSLCTLSLPGYFGHSLSA